MLAGLWCGALILLTCGGTWHGGCMLLSHCTTQAKRATCGCGCAVARLQRLHIVAMGYEACAGVEHCYQGYESCSTVALACWLHYIHYVTCSRLQLCVDQCIAVPMAPGACCCRHWRPACCAAAAGVADALQTASCKRPMSKPAGCHCS